MTFQAIPNTIQLLSDGVKRAAARTEFALRLAVRRCEADAGTACSYRKKAEPVIDDFIAALGAELISENNADFIPEFKKMMRRLLQVAGCISPLSVYAESVSTVNVVGGRYNYDGEVKTYTPRVAVNPTDNDTAYVWMDDANTIGYGIDGDGWPETEHIKLAEIDVDSDVIITTNIRDMRTAAFAITAAE